MNKEQLDLIIEWFKLTREGFEDITQRVENLEKQNKCDECPMKQCCPCDDICQEYMPVEYAIQEDDIANAITWFIDAFADEAEVVTKTTAPRLVSYSVVTREWKKTFNVQVTVEDVTPLNK